MQNVTDMVIMETILIKVYHPTVNRGLRFKVSSWKGSEFYSQNGKDEIKEQVKKIAIDYCDKKGVSRKSLSIGRLKNDYVVIPNN